MSDGNQFCKTAPPLQISVSPAQAHVTVSYEPDRTYHEEGYNFSEGVICLTNASRGVVEIIEFELFPPPAIELVGTSSQKTINMLSPGRSVSFPIVLKSSKAELQHITLSMQVNRDVKSDEIISINFEAPEIDEEIEEDTEWLKDLE